MDRVRIFLINLLTAALIVCISAAQADVHAKVINGNKATPGAWPFMAALIAKGSSSSASGQYCGGSLIGPQHILTAAHCAFGVDPRDIAVQIGGSDLSFDPLNAKDVLGITVHPNFNYDELTNDLAIIKLKEPVATTPVSLALSSDSSLYTDGTVATLIGYGKTDPAIPILPFTLQQANIPIASDQTCMDEIGRYFNPATQLCAGTKASSSTAGDGVGACNGDSGGPLLAPDGVGGFKQVGVVSWGIGSCANNKTRGVFSRVMANDSFVTSFPLAKPIAEGTPGIPTPTTPTAGSVLTCVPPTFYGDAPSQVTYRWYRSYTEQISNATLSNYTVTEQDTSVGCSVEASNSAGTSGEARSDFVTISVPPAPTPTPVPDTTKPTGSIRSLACSGRACSFVAIALDDASGVASVRLKVQISYAAKASAKGRSARVKRVTIKRVITAHSLYSTVWEGEFRLRSNTKQRINSTLMVRDSAGNNNAAADTREIQVVAK